MKASNDFKSSLEVPRDVFGSWYKIWDPQGDPREPAGPPFEVQKIRHVVYQFYSDSSNENEYRVNTSKF